MVLKMEMIDLRNEQLATPSKYVGLGAAITAELMIGFWFGVGDMLAVGVGNGLSHFVRAVTSGKKVTANNRGRRKSDTTSNDERPEESRTG